MQVCIAVIALFFDQLEQIETPAGEGDDDELTENFRYVKAHFANPSKVFKAISKGLDLIEENEIDQSNVEAAQEIIQNLPEPDPSVTGNDDIRLLHDFVLAFLEFFFAAQKIVSPEKRERSNSNTSRKKLESLSRKSRSKASKQDLVQTPADAVIADDPIEQVGLPQDTKGVKHMRTKSHIKTPPETIMESEGENRERARIRSTSREKEVPKRIEEVHSDSESKHGSSPQSDAKTKLFISEPKQETRLQPEIVSEENSAVIHEDEPEIQPVKEESKPLESIDVSPIMSDQSGSNRLSPEHAANTALDSPEDYGHSNSKGAENARDSRQREISRSKVLGRSIDTIPEETASRREESELGDDNKAVKTTGFGIEIKKFDSDMATSQPKSVDSTKDRVASKSKEPVKKDVSQPKREKSQPNSKPASREPSKTTKPAERKDTSHSKSREPAKAPAQKTVKEPVKPSPRDTKKDATKPTTKQPSQPAAKVPQKPAEKSVDKTKTKPDTKTEATKSTTASTKKADSTTKSTAKLSTDASRSKLDKTETDKSREKLKTVATEKQQKSQPAKPETKPTQAKPKSTEKTTPTTTPAKAAKPADRSVSKEATKKAASVSKNDSKLNASKTSAQESLKNSSVLNKSDSKSKIDNSRVSKDAGKTKGEKLPAIVEAKETAPAVSQQKASKQPAKPPSTSTKAGTATVKTDKSQTDIRKSSVSKANTDKSVDKSKLSAAAKDEPKTVKADKSLDKSKASVTSKGPTKSNRGKGDISKLSSVQSESESESRVQTAKPATHQPSDQKGNWKKSGQASTVAVAQSVSKDPKEKQKPVQDSKGAQKGKVTPGHPPKTNESDKKGPKPDLKAKKDVKESASVDKKGSKGKSNDGKKKVPEAPPAPSIQSVSTEKKRSPPRSNKLGGKHAASSTIFNRTALDKSNYNSRHSLADTSAAPEDQPKLKILPLEAALATLHLPNAYVNSRKALRTSRSEARDFLSRNREHAKAGLAGVNQLLSQKSAKPKPTFRDQDFVYVREHKDKHSKAQTDAEAEDHSELEDEEARVQSARQPAKKNEPVSAIFKRFAKKTEKLIARARSAKVETRAKYAQTKFDRMMARPSKTKHEGPSLVRRFQEDSQLLQNHLIRKEENTNPKLVEVEKERELIKELRLRQSTLQFTLDREHRQAIKEEEKESEMKEAEYHRNQRLRALELEKAEAAKARALERQRKSENLAESKRIKAEIKEIMTKNFEDEKRIYVDHAHSGTEQR